MPLCSSLLCKLSTLPSFPPTWWKGYSLWLPWLLSNSARLSYLTWRFSLIRPRWMGSKSPLHPFIPLWDYLYNYKPESLASEATDVQVNTTLDGGIYPRWKMSTFIRMILFLHYKNTVSSQHHLILQALLQSHKGCPVFGFSSIFSTFRSVDSYDDSSCLPQSNCEFVCSQSSSNFLSILCQPVFLSISTIFTTTKLIWFRLGLAQIHPNKFSEFKAFSEEERWRKTLSITYLKNNILA